MFKVSITGASGFVGRQLVNRCREHGWFVRGLTRNPNRCQPTENYEVFKGDLAAVNSDFKGFLSDVDVVFHCAAELRDPSKMHAVHVQGTRALLQASKEAGIGRFVYLSSVGAYGRCSLPSITEDIPPAPVGTYEITKTQAEELVIHSGIPYFILRPSIIYGPGMPSRHFVNLIRLIDLNLFVFVGKKGAIDCHIHLDNVVEAMILCATARQVLNRIYNLSESQTFEEFVGDISESLGKRPSVMRIPYWPAWFLARTLGRVSGFPLTRESLRYFTRRSVYNSERIAQELGYRPIKTQASGIKDMVLIYKDALQRDRWG